MSISNMFHNDEIKWILEVIDAIPKDDGFLYKVLTDSLYKVIRKLKEPHTITIGFEIPSTPEPISGFATFPPNGIYGVDWDRKGDPTIAPINYRPIYELLGHEVSGFEFEEKHNAEDSRMQSVDACGLEVICCGKCKQIYYELKRKTPIQRRFCTYCGGAFGL